MQEIDVPMQHCPSFNSYSSSISFAEVAAKVIQDQECTSHRDNEEFEFCPFSDDTKQTPPNGEENNSDDDFEFASVNCRDTGSSLPISPIFNQNIGNFKEVVLLQEDTTNKIRKVSSFPGLPLGRLFLKEFSSSTSSSTSSSSSETDADLPSHCIWKPKTFTTSPDRTYCPNKKSKSIGNSNKPKSFRIRDLIYRRSNSDFNKTYVANYAQPSLPNTDNKSSNGKSLVSIPRRDSVKGTKEDAKRMDRKLLAKKEGVNKRRSFLHYKRDLIVFFGFNRKLHPLA